MSNFVSASSVVPAYVTTYRASTRTTIEKGLVDPTSLPKSLVEVNKVGLNTLVNGGESSVQFFNNVKGRSFSTLSSAQQNWLKAIAGRLNTLMVNCQLIEAPLPPAPPARVNRPSRTPTILGGSRPRGQQTISSFFGKRPHEGDESPAKRK